MSNMAIGYRIAIIFCITTIISVGCFPYQLVDKELLEKNKGKTFTVGLVIADGSPMNGWYTYDPWGPFYIEYKKIALDNIPIEEICSLLSSRYSITIDCSVDKTVRVSKAIVQDQAWDGNNPQTRPVAIAYYGDPIKAKDFPDFVNVTYSGGYCYDIGIISSKKKIVELHGIAGKTSPEGFLYSYMENARHISEALKKDLVDKNQFEVDDRTGRSSEAFKKDLTPF